MSVEGESIIITKQEMNECFDLHHGQMIETLYTSIKDKCDDLGMGILFNDSIHTPSEFKDLIKNYVDIVDAYKKRYKFV